MERQRVFKWPAVLTPPPAVGILDSGTRGCSSVWLECRPVKPEVAGSNPVSPAIYEARAPKKGAGPLLFLSRHCSGPGTLFGAVLFFIAYRIIINH